MRRFGKALSYTRASRHGGWMETRVGKSGENDFGRLIGGRGFLFLNSVSCVSYKRPLAAGIAGFRV
ncbi:hypothetical protein [Erythrobacter sp.]|uniref:hypothetical protein n=1 Tax=Erythrobacter sp. TaxID=1042 RepID=UPI0025D8F96D|nr:hypothetical protein [Erythrobacter sp.]